MLSNRDKYCNAYKLAGEDLLAFRLRSVLSKIDTEQDRILHNEVVDEISMLIGDNPKTFLESIAELLLRMNWERPKERFLGLVANRILSLAQKRKG